MTDEYLKGIMDRPARVVEGSEEGDRCNRQVVNHSFPDGSTTIACAGTMEFPEVENCSCHIAPPCFAHENLKPVCSECEAEAE